MIVLLSKYIGEPSSIVVSLLSRFITMVGDLLFYIVSLSLGKSRIDLQSKR
jgi:hypothetical protein